MNKLLVFDTDELSDFIHTSPDTLRYWRHLGKGPKFFRLGGKKVSYRHEDVEAWVAEQYEASKGPVDSVA